MTITTQPIVKLHKVFFSYEEKPVLKNINMAAYGGQIVAIMGPSGCGKTTLLKLIGRQYVPQKGEVWFDGKNITTISRNELYLLRKKMSILFQSGALFNELSVFNNIAFPLTAHLQLPFDIVYTLVLMKLEAVGLRGAKHLMPNQLSGGMARRVALARALALDPMLIMFDEPFVGQDPITTGVLIKLIKDINKVLGITCIIVTHDTTNALSISDYSYIMTDHEIIAHGKTQDLYHCRDARAQQFLVGTADGPVPFHYPADEYREELFFTDNKNI